ncbi:MAG TPA: hypothetical protein VK814_08665 [Acidobacteriaceae bacterium]|nr:hypothetical protein [Acidobacteriaceae bacterium]
MSIRKIGLIVAVAILLGLAFLAGRQYPSAINKQNTQESTAGTIETAQITSPPQSEASSVQKPAIPTISGHTYHPLDLLQQRPFPDQGTLVRLNVPAMAHVMDGRVLAYDTIPGHEPQQANDRGLRFSQRLGADICIYDVVQWVAGDGVEVPESAGQIAVEIKPGMLPPSTERVWDVMPDGVEEVTSSDGTLRHLPMIRFWNYHGQETDN